MRTVFHVTLVLVGISLAVLGYEELRLTLSCPDCHTLAWSELARTSEGPLHVQVQGNRSALREHRAGAWRVFSQREEATGPWLLVPQDTVGEPSEGLLYVASERQHDSLQRELAVAGRPGPTRLVIFEAGRTPLGAGFSLLAIALGAFLAYLPLAPHRVRREPCSGRYPSARRSPRAVATGTRI